MNTLQSMLDNYQPLQAPIPPADLNLPAQHQTTCRIVGEQANSPRDPLRLDGFGGGLGGLCLLTVSVATEGESNKCTRT